MGQFRQGEWEQAWKHLQECDDTDAKRWIACFERLADGSTRREAAEWRLRAMREIGDRGVTFSKAEASRWQRLQAQALAEAGDFAQAAERYAVLKRAEPRNGDIAAAYARAVAQDTTCSCEAKLQAWREVLAAAPSGSPWWWEAKYGLAAALVECGEPRRALNMIQLMRATTAGWDEAEWSPQLEALSEQLEQQFGTDEDVPSPAGSARELR